MNNFCLSESKDKFGRPVLIYGKSTFYRRFALVSGEEKWCCSMKKCSAKIYTIGSGNDRTITSDQTRDNLDHLIRCEKSTEGYLKKDHQESPVNNYRKRQKSVNAFFANYGKIEGGKDVNFKTLKLLNDASIDYSLEGQRNVDLVEHEILIEKDNECKIEIEEGVLHDEYMNEVEENTCQQMIKKEIDDESAMKYESAIKIEEPEKNECIKNTPSENQQDINLIKCEESIEEDVKREIEIEDTISYGDDEINDDNIEQLVKKEKDYETVQEYEFKDILTSSIKEEFEPQTEETEEVNEDENMFNNEHHDKIRDIDASMLEIEPQEVSTNNEKSEERKPRFADLLKSAQVYKCKECDFRTNNNVKLRKHIESTHLQYFKCEICNYGAKRQRTVKTHMESVHLKIKNFSCELCDFKTYYSKSFRRHLDEIHLLNKKIECQFCNYTSYFPFRLRYHVKRIHQKIECNICDFTCNYKRKLKEHMDINHPRLKIEKCDYCDYSSNVTKLKYHIENVHLKVKPFKCNQCDYSSSYRYHFVSHKERVHSKQSVKCQYCDFSCRLKVTLNAHVKNVHIKT